MPRDTFYDEQLKNNLIEWSKKVVSGGCDPLEGCRTIVRLVAVVGDKQLQEHPAVMTLRGIESETDTFPIGTARLAWRATELQSLDEQREEYMKQVDGQLKTACREVVMLLEGI